MGYTPHLAAAVWVGDPQGRRSLSDIRINSRYYAYVYGGTIAGPIWRSVMSSASRDYPASDFVFPSRIPSGGSGVTGALTLRTPTPTRTSTSTQTSKPTTKPSPTSEPSDTPTPTPTSTTTSPDPTSSPSQNQSETSPP